MEKDRVRQAMNKELIGISISNKLIVKLPDDGCHTEIDMPHREVYAARAGKAILFAYVYDNGTIIVKNV